MTMKGLLPLSLGSLLFLLTFVSGTALGQQPPAPGKADSEGFVPENRPAMMNPVDERVAAPPLVAAAYSFIWVALLVFVGTVAMRTTRLEGEIAELRRKLEAGGK